MPDDGKEAERMFEAMNKDGNGEVSYDELHNYLKEQDSYEETNCWPIYIYIYIWP